MSLLANLLKLGTNGLHYISILVIYFRKFVESFEAKMDLSKKPHRQVALKETLSPLWKTSYYCGLLFDWCHPIRNQGVISVFLSWISIFFVMFLLFFFSVLDATRFVVFLFEQHEGLVTLSVHFFPKLVALATQISFLVYRNDMQNYFFYFRKSLEKPMTVSHRFGSVKRTSIIMYIFYSAFPIMYNAYNSVGIFDSNNSVFNEVILTTFESYFKENEWASMLYRTSKFLAFLLSMLFYAIADLVPAFAYFHMALALNELTHDIETISTKISTNNLLKTESNKFSTDSVDYIQSCWSRFVAIRRGIRRTDQLFGPLIIFNHGTLFFAICGTFYDMSQFLIQHHSVPPIMLLSQMMSISRLLFGITLMMRVFTFANQLQATVTEISCTHWKSLKENEHRILSPFMSELQSCQLAASPSNLYCIKPSIFLSMLSLVVTYTIVLISTRTN